MRPFRSSTRSLVGSIIAACVFDAWPSVLSAGSDRASAQQPFQAADSLKQAITPELSAYVENLIHDAAVPGLSLGVVRLSDHGSIYTEFGAWGNSTEDFDPVTPKVRSYRGNRL